LPIRAAITAANVNDISAVQDWPLQPGECYVFDKRYCDYAWWQRIAEAGSVFVTRFKRNAKLRVVAERPLPADAVDLILSDEEVVLSNLLPRGSHRNPYTGRLRRSMVSRPGHNYGSPRRLPLMTLRASLLQRKKTEASHYQHSPERKQALAERQGVLFA
jgi:hypothetical protein